MNCVPLNTRTVLLIILSLVLKTWEFSTTSNDIKTHNFKKMFMENSTSLATYVCPKDLECTQLNYPCIECKYDYNCTYGAEVEVTCTPAPGIKCNGRLQFTRKMLCRYCYQTNVNEHYCDAKNNCRSTASPKEYYQTNCSVYNLVLCLGNRKFLKKQLCNWTSGFKWKTALILSVTLGGFGADRFYLGHWQEGIGKLFSFGGLGVWTLIDVVLISLHYLGPVDGSLYI